jgi:hypothetical protein
MRRFMPFLNGSLHPDASPAAFGMEPADGGRFHRVSMTPVEVTRQDKRAAKGYTMIDPAAFARAFEADGMKVDWYGSGAFRRVLLAHDRDPVGDGRGKEAYYSAAAVLFGHDGRTAFRVTPGVVRIFCLNQFQTSYLSISHMDSVSLRPWIESPAESLRRLMVEASDLPVMLTTLLDTRSELPEGTAAAYTRGVETMPRVKHWTRGLETWGLERTGEFLQAITQAHSPTLQTLANRIVPKIHCMYRTGSPLWVQKAGEITQNEVNRWADELHAAAAKRTERKARKLQAESAPALSLT